MDNSSESNDSQSDLDPDVAIEGAGSSKPSKNRLLRGLGVVLVGLIAIAFSQVTAPETDHQVANMISVVIGLLTAIGVVYQAFRHFSSQGKRSVVPIGLVLIGIASIALLEFDGFSGEMLPQFSWRFGKQTPQLRSLNDRSTSEMEADSESQFADQSVASLSFLGSERTGITSQREFDVPAGSEAKVLWDQGIGEGWGSFAVASGRAVTLEQREDLECVTCYRLSDGDLLWMVSYAARHENALGGIGPRTTPTIVGELVYTQGGTGQLRCLELKSGTIVWEQDLLKLAGWDQLESEAAITWGRATSPLIVDDLCVVAYGGPQSNEKTGRSLIAFDRETGDLKWTAGADQISYGSPIVMTLAGQRQIVSVNEKTVTGHRVENGEVLWDFDWPGQSNGGANCAMAIPAGENRFLVGKGYGGGSALVEVTATEAGEFQAQDVWMLPNVLKTKFTHACVDGDVAYAISNGSLEAVSISEGERLWTQPRRSRFGQGQILLSDGVIVAQSETGEVVFVEANPEEYRELIRLPAMASKTWNIPTIAGRYLLVRNDRQAICYLLPERTN